MTKSWNPPKTIEKMYKDAYGSEFPGMNRPTAGKRDNKKLESGDSDIQLYSLGTPNGQKVGILFEEIRDIVDNFSYDAHFVDIGSGDQFSEGFVDINPNSKIPTVLAKNNPSQGEEVKLFESGSICLYFAEKYNLFIPGNTQDKAEMMNWVFWQMGSQGPMTGQFGHFYNYSPETEIEARNYGVMRYGMEAQRLCSVLDQHLSGKTYMMGDLYTIADMMIYPWFNALLASSYQYKELGAYDFLNIKQYKNAVKWAETMAARPAVKRGMRVCSYYEAELGVKPWLNE